MKILVVTGRFGIEVLEKLRNIFPEIFPSDVELKYLNMTGGLISFLSDKYIEDIVRKEISKDRFDLVIVPYGFSIKVDNVPVIYLKHVSDIPALLMYLKYCNDIPRDIKNLYEKISKYQEYIESFVIENSYRVRYYRAEFGRRSRFRVNGLPPLIIAEIVDATRINLNTCVEIALKYVDEGASIIDVGCVAGSPNPARVYEVVRELSREIPDNVGISVDSLSIQEIEAGVRAGVDLILSITRGMLDKLNFNIKDVGVVVIPDRDSDDINYLHSYFEYCSKYLESRGAIPIIDPLLKPPIFNLSKSICRYVNIRELFKDRPILMGFGNVVELMDVDPHGVYALLSAIAVELEIDLILTTEASVKTRNSIEDLKTALYMCTAAKILSKYPKDMSRNLLKLRRKWD